MRRGDRLNGYTVVTEPTNRDAGKSVWAFAERDGAELFIKEFLDPKWPLDSSPGSAEGRLIRRRTCEQFERRHREVTARLRSQRVGSGNIVVAQDFFRVGTTYYKVTARIDPSGLEDLTGLSVPQQAVVLRTLALSLRQLHRIDVVHGDLKPSNALVQHQPGSGLYTAKLIDFDDSYVAGQPPERPAEIGGDQRYGAPEWLRYVQGDSTDRSSLTTAVDMFALGLMLHLYLTGVPPAFDTARFAAPGEAVNAGHPLVPSPDLSPVVQGLVVDLTAAEAARRPTVEDVLAALEDDGVLDPSRAVSSTNPRNRATRVRIGPGLGQGGERPRSPGPAPVSGTPEGARSGAAPGRNGARTSRVRIRMDGGTAPNRRPAPPPGRD